MELSLPVKKIVESPQVYAAVLTHAHWERYYLTTGYRFFFLNTPLKTDARFGL